MHVFLSPELSKIKRRMIVFKKQGKAWGIPARHGKSPERQNPQDCKIPGTAKSSGQLNHREGKIHRIIQSPGQQNPGKSRAGTASLYIYKVEAIFKLCFQSTPTVLKIEG